MYHFFLYSRSAGGQKCISSYVALKLLETLPKNEHLQVYFDNWFSSVSLFLVWKQNVCLALATRRVYVTKKCPRLTKKVLRKQGRGSRCYYTDTNTGISVTRWYDNKCVQFISNFCNPEEVSKVKIWDRKNKKCI